MPLALVLKLKGPLIKECAVNLKNKAPYFQVYSPVEGYWALWVLSIIDFTHSHELPHHGASVDDINPWHCPMDPKLWELWYIPYYG